jgi:hypothetical protein
MIVGFPIEVKNHCLDSDTVAKARTVNGAGISFVVAVTKRR